MYWSSTRVLNLSYPCIRFDPGTLVLVESLVDSFNVFFSARLAGIPAFSKRAEILILFKTLFFHKVASAVLVSFSKTSKSAICDLCQFSVIHEKNELFEKRDSETRIMFKVQLIHSFDSQSFDRLEKKRKTMAIIETEPF